MAPYLNEALLSDVISICYLEVRIGFRNDSSAKEENEWRGIIEGGMTALLLERQMGLCDHSFNSVIERRNFRQC